MSSKMFTVKKSCALMLVMLQAGNCWPSRKIQIKKGLEEGSLILWEPWCCVPADFSGEIEWRWELRK